MLSILLVGYGLIVVLIAAWSVNIIRSYIHFKTLNHTEIHRRAG